MVVVKFSLIDAVGGERGFERLTDAVNWINGVGADMFISVRLTDAYDNSVEGLYEVMTAYHYNADLYGGSPACLHMKIEHPSGGGTLCEDCGAWFCY